MGRSNWATFCVASFVVATSASSAAGAEQVQPSAIDRLSKAEAPTLATVAPPKQPTLSRAYISEKKLAELPEAQQPKALSDTLMSLTTGSMEERQARLKAKVFADMVYVHGGKFQMGDFAKLLGIPGITRMTSKEDDKVVHEVTLSDFWISKYKVTYAEFDVFTEATGRKQTGMEYDASLRHPLVPARAYWQEAKDYCLWLGQLTGLPMTLPTEAQWEYAARSRGQFFMIPTDNGNVEYGRNMLYDEQAEKVSPLSDFGRYPIGLTPPNPLGLFDMTRNGLEWVNDWYAANAYSKAARRDPQGPPTGVKKVARSGGADSPLVGAAVHRYSSCQCRWTRMRKLASQFRVHQLTCQRCVALLHQSVLRAGDGHQN
jgi:sulfatase modifying factor 1